VTEDLNLKFNSPWFDISSFYLTATRRMSERSHMIIKKVIVLSLLMIFSIGSLALGGQNNNRRDRRENNNQNNNQMERRDSVRHNGNGNWPSRRRRQRRKHWRRKHVM